MSGIEQCVLERHIKQLKQVHYLCLDIQNTQSIEQMFDKVLSECISLTESTGGSIMLRRRRTNVLSFYAVQGLDLQKVKQTKIHVGDGIAGNVVLEGIPRIVNNITLDPKYITINSSIKSEMAIPIKIKDYTIGVIVLDNTSSNAYTDQHLELIQIIISYVGFAIAHFFETVLLKKNTQLLDSILNIPSTASATEIFSLLNRTLQITSSCIIDKDKQVLFHYREMIEPIINQHIISTNNTEVFLLETNNEQGIPYTRIVIPRNNGRIFLIFDKLYDLSETEEIDILFAKKLLELISKKTQVLRSEKDSNEVISDWIKQQLSGTNGTIYDTTIEEVERELIIQALIQNKDNRLKTSRFLGINRNTLRHKIEFYNLEK